jgi:hypothetical protein
VPGIISSGEASNVANIGRICNKETSDTHKLFIQLDMLALECVEEMRRVKRGARWQVYRQDPSSVFSCLEWTVRVRERSSVLQAGLDMCFRPESGGLLWPALSLCGQAKQACETWLPEVFTSM